MIFTIEYQIDRSDDPPLLISVIIRADNAELALFEATRELCLGLSFHHYRSVFLNPDLVVLGVRVLLQSKETIAL